MDILYIVGLTILVTISIVAGIALRRLNNKISRLQLAVESMLEVLVDSCNSLSNLAERSGFSHPDS